MNVRRLSIAGLIVLAMALGGCAGSAGVATSVSPSPALATVSGTVRIYGGPMLPNGKMAANGNPMQAVAPVVVKQSGQVVKRSSTNSQGHYSLSLPAGTYVISAGCSQPATVLGAGETVTRDLQCDVP